MGARADAGQGASIGRPSSDQLGATLGRNDPSRVRLSRSVLLRGHPLAPELGTVIALVGDALAVAIDPMPRIETSDGPLLHIEDPRRLRSARPAVRTSSPCRPARSGSTDYIALRLIMPVSWAMRASGGVASMQGASW